MPLIFELKLRSQAQNLKTLLDYVDVLLIFWYNCRLKAPLEQKLASILKTWFFLYRFILT